MNIEDFEFKPMTEGLGFDKKAEEVKHQTFSSKIDIKVDSEPFIETKTEKPVEEKPPLNDAPVSRSLKKMLDSLPPSLDFTVDKEREKSFVPPATPYTPPIPQKKDMLVPTAPNLPVQNPVTPAGNPFDVTLDNSLKNAFPRIETEKRFFHQTVKLQPQFTEITASFASAVIDGLVALGISAVFAVILVVITGVDLFHMIRIGQANKVMFELAALYAGTIVIYFMIARGLFGSTLGDWAFDVELGNKEERLKVTYPFQVLFRSIVILVTGVIIVPILSFAFNKDMAYYFSGLKLYCRQY